MNRVYSYIMDFLQQYFPAMLCLMLYKVIPTSHDF